MAYKIVIDTKSIAPFSAMLRKLPRGIAKEVVLDVSLFLASNQGFGKYAPQRYVSRAAAYGKTFFTPRQQRYVMMMIGKGKIVPGKYRRTGTARAGWAAIQKGSWAASVVNRTKDAYYTMGAPGQSRHEKRVGWLDTAKWIIQNRVKIMAVATAAAKRYIAKARATG